MQELYPSERNSSLALDGLVSRADWKMLEAIGRVCIAYDPIRGGRPIGRVLHAKEGIMRPDMGDAEGKSLQ